MDDLALQVGDVDDVEVDDADGAHAGRREVEHRRRAEAAGADEEHAGVQQPGLAVRADLRDEQVARVALLLLAWSGRPAVVHGRPSDFQAWKPPLMEATSV